MSIEYRPLSILAVISAVCCGLSLIAFFAVEFLFLAFVAVVTAFVSTWHIRRYQTKGVRINHVSIVISLTVLICAPAWQYFLYSSESLPGYERVHFIEENADHNGWLDEYDGRKICLKGYVIAPNDLSFLRQVEFSANGDRRNEENRITVKFPDSWNYQYEPVAVSGVLKVDHRSVEPARRYVLIADEMRAVNSDYGLQSRSLGDGC